MTALSIHQQRDGIKTTAPRKRGTWRGYLGAAVLLLLLTASQASAAERLAVNVAKANVRSGPGTSHEIMWEVERYYPVVIIKKSGAWYLFRDFEKDEGWLKKTLLAKIPTVITVKQECNIRSGPGTKFPISFKTQDKGVPFKVLKRKGKWINVQHADGDKGWIFKSLVW